MKAKSYKDFAVWQKAMDLVVNVYEATKEFPKEETYGLCSQMRRCAVSIPSNIAEGSRRGSKGEFRHFLGIAYGSGAELETQLEISIRLKYIDQDKVESMKSLLTEVVKMLNSFISKT